VARWDTWALPAKVIHHFNVPGHLAQEVLGRFLGGHDAGGLDILNTHAPGDVRRARIQTVL
jgi:hypothetical protein